MKRTSTMIVAVVGVLILVTVAVWYGRERALWHANETFADNLIASAQLDTLLHREVLSTPDLAALTKKRDLLVGRSRRVLADETWGTTEFGYCFQGGTYAYLTVPTRGDPPKPATLAVYESATTPADHCRSP
jgi:hypothetical protein